MSLSKQQLLGAIGAGVFVLGAGGLGFCVYSAWSERGEAEEALQGAAGGFQGHYNAPVFPSKKSLDSVTSNKTAYATWLAEAQTLAAKGDKVFPAETPPIFKQRLQREVRRMAALPGGVEGRIAAPNFLFGFEQYLGEGGVLPQDGDVPRLARQLDAIAQVVDLLADVGALEVKSIRRIEPKAAEDDEEETRGKKAKKGDAAAEEGPKVSMLDYAFEFTAHPDALVETLNRLTASPRFMTVKNLAFRETADVIVEHLNAVEAAKNQKAASRSARRGRGRGAATATTTAMVAEVDPLVVDPELDAPILVSFTLEVRDFGRGVAPAPAAEVAAPVATNAVENVTSNAAPKEVSK